MGARQAPLRQPDLARAGTPTRSAHLRRASTGSIRRTPRRTTSRRSSTRFRRRIWSHGRSTRAFSTHARHVGDARGVGAVGRREGRRVLSVLRRQRHPERSRSVGRRSASRARRRPGGPFEDHLGKPLVDAFHNGAQPIDPFVFADTDGTYYLIYGGWRHCNIAKLNADFTGFVPFADGTTFKEITPHGYVEGSFMFVRRTGSTTSCGRRAAGPARTTPSRTRSARRRSARSSASARFCSRIRPSRPAPAITPCCTRPVRIDWYIVYHRRPLGDTDRNHRVVCIDEMRFDADGRILPVTITTTGVEAAPLGALTSAV